MIVMIPKRSSTARHNGPNLIGENLLFATQIICLGAMLGGCGGGPLEVDPASGKHQAATKRKEMTRARYFIGMLNNTGRDLAGVGVYYGNKMAADKGVLVARGLATYGFVPLAIPKEAIVKWIDRGVEHAATVGLQGIPSEFGRKETGMLYFIIEPNGSVTVRTADHGDIEACLKIEMPVQHPGAPIPHVSPVPAPPPPGSTGQGKGASN
jgi:hypothetical protein